MELAQQKCLLYIILTALLVSCSSSKGIADKPIVFDEEREALSLEYLSERYDLVQASSAIVPRMIVLHWTAIATLEDSYGAFVPETLPGSRSDLAGAGAVNVSIQFLVDRDGTVFRLMPETWMARHVIGLNHAAVGVENVGGAGSIDDMTLTEMGSLMYESHFSYSACGLGSDGTDRLVEMVRRAGPGAGLYGGKITGGGSGGTVAVLGRREAGSEVASIAKRYGEETGCSPVVFAGSSPGAFRAGVRWLTADGVIGRESRS